MFNQLYENIQPIRALNLASKRKAKPARQRVSKYTPHQGEREKARRRKQLATLRQRHEAESA